MTAPNDRTGERKVWKRGWKRPLSEGQVRQRQEAGRALFNKHGPEYMAELAKSGGGRPTFWAALEKATSNGRELLYDRGYLPTG